MPAVGAGVTDEVGFASGDELDVVVCGVLHAVSDAMRSSVIRLVIFFIVFSLNACFEITRAAGVSI